MIPCPPAARFVSGLPASGTEYPCQPWPSPPTARSRVAVNGNHMLGATRVFDLVSGRALYTLGGREGTAIEAAAISPDGRTIVTKQDFSLRIRDAATGKELRKIELQRVKALFRIAGMNGSPSRRTAKPSP